MDTSKRLFFGINHGVTIQKRRNHTEEFRKAAVCRWLARALGSSPSVTLVDSNENHCMVSKSEGLTAIHGSVLQEQVLSEAQAGRTELVIAMTPNVEVNTIVAQTARNVFQIPEVHLLQAGSGLDDLALIRKHLKAEPCLRAL